MESFISNALHYAIIGLFFYIGFFMSHFILQFNRSLHFIDKNNKMTLFRKGFMRSYCQFFLNIFVFFEKVTLFVAEPVLKPLRKIFTTKSGKDYSVAVFFIGLMVIWIALINLRSH